MSKATQVLAFLPATVSLALLQTGSLIWHPITKAKGLMQPWQDAKNITGNVLGILLMGLVGISGMLLSPFYLVGSLLFSAGGLLLKGKKIIEWTQTKSYFNPAWMEGVFKPFVGVKAVPHHPKAQTSESSQKGSEGKNPSTKKDASDSRQLSERVWDALQAVVPEDKRLDGKDRKEGNPEAFKSYSEVYFSAFGTVFKKYEVVTPLTLTIKKANDVFSRSFLDYACEHGYVELALYLAELHKKENLKEYFFSLAESMTTVDGYYALRDTMRGYKDEARVFERQKKRQEAHAVAKSGDDEKQLYRWINWIADDLQRGVLKLENVHSNIIKYLCENGKVADLSPRFLSNQSVLMQATTANRADVVEMLAKAMIDYNEDRYYDVDKKIELLKNALKKAGSGSEVEKVLNKWLRALQIDHEKQVASKDLKNALKNGWIPKIESILTTYPDIVPVGAELGELFEYYGNDSIDGVVWLCKNKASQILPGFSDMIVKLDASYHHRSSIPKLFDALLSANVEGGADKEAIKKACFRLKEYQRLNLDILEWLAKNYDKIAMDLTAPLVDDNGNKKGNWLLTVAEQNALSNNEHIIKKFWVRFFPIFTLFVDAVKDKSKLLEMLRCRDTVFVEAVKIQSYSIFNVFSKKVGEQETDDLCVASVMKAIYYKRDLEDVKKTIQDVASQYPSIWRGTHNGKSFAQQESYFYHEQNNEKLAQWIGEQENKYLSSTADIKACP